MEGKHSDTAVESGIIRIMIVAAPKGLLWGKAAAVLCWGDLKGRNCRVRHYPLLQGLWRKIHQSVPHLHSFPFFF